MSAVPPDPIGALGMISALVRDYLSSLQSRPGTQQCVAIVAEQALKTLNDALKPVPDASPPD